MVAASSSRRPSGDGFWPHTWQSTFTSSRDLQAASAPVMSGGTTLPQRNASPRSTMNANPTTEVSPSMM